MALAPGARLANFEILRAIGAGGMGEVYEARDLRLGRRVAVKVLPEVFASDPDRLARFEREARGVAALSHPNILALHDVGREGPVVYAVMELLEGMSLRETLAAGPLPPRKAIEYGVQIAQGLAAAPESGLAHRDLKPENVFVTRDDRVKVLDLALPRRSTPRRPAPRWRTPAPPRQAPCSAPWATWHPSRSAASPRTTARTSSRSAPCCTKCSRAGARSTARRPPTRSVPS